MEKFQRKLANIINEFFLDMPELQNALHHSKPFAMGFTIKFGPGRKPRKSRPCRKRIRFGVKPFYEVRYEKDCVHILAMLPGVKEESIIVDVRPDWVRIAANEDYARYYKEIPLKCTVKPESTKRSFNNGVLELIIEKSKAK